MSDEAVKKLLLEEQRNAVEHLRFLDTKRDRFVIGTITASAAVLALITQIFSNEPSNPASSNELLKRFMLRTSHRRMRTRNSLNKLPRSSRLWGYPSR